MNDTQLQGMPRPAQPDPADLLPVERDGRSLRLLIVDNYDSFTYNLVQYLGEQGAELTILRNDQFDLEDVRRLDPDGIVISPGPCTPAEAGQSVPLVREFAGEYPILGVCLGHQAIAAAFGGNVVRAPVLMHGKTSSISHDGSSLFRGLPQPVTVTRYHSLIVRDLPPELRVTATVDDDGQEVVMAMEHTHHPVFGVQFHPESILTSHGHRLLRNFLQACASTPARV